MTEGRVAGAVADFADAAEVAAWAAVDDRVMGGVSTSRLAPGPEQTARFEGVVRLDFGGGFASVRGPLLGAVARERLGRAAALRLTVRGDGRRYKLGLRVDEGLDGIVHQAAFCPAAGVWTVIDLSPADFEPRFRGRLVAGAPALALSAVRRFGLVVGDRQAGPFLLELSRIDALCTD